MGDIEGFDILYSSGFIGHGSYGSVYKARNKETGEFAAVKRIIIPSHDFESRLKSVRSEIKYVKLLGDKHKHILKMIKTQEEEDGPRLYVQIVTEYCTLRDLEYYAMKYYLTVRHRLKIMYQAASGLAFMHGQNPPVIHRDIKPSNILMTEENGQHVVRLADFGLARPIEGSRSMQTMTNAGTENFMAPEQFDETDFWLKLTAQFSKSGAQDAFAFGVLCYQLMQSNPLNGLECPEVTKVIIGKMMMRIGEVEAEIDKNKEEWKAEAIQKEEEYQQQRKSMSFLSKLVESKQKKEAVKAALKTDIVGKERIRREDLWKVKNLTSIKMIEPTKSWNPIVINDSDSSTIKAAKEVIKSVVKFDPRQRSSMAEVEARLEHIIKDTGPQSGLPALITDSFKTLMQYKHHPAMEKITLHKIGFCASVYMGFSNRGAILEDEDNGSLVLLSLKEAGYTKEWQKNRPDRVRPRSAKYILSDGNIVFRQDDVTVVCDGDLNPIHIHTGDYGSLRGVVQNDILLYVKQSYVLNMYDCTSHQHVCRLPVSVRSGWISTASHPASGWFVLTHWDGTMSMFTSDYQLHMQVQLGFRPDSRNGVCCIGNLIAVISWGGRGIVWYNWLGDEVKRVGREEMGVEGRIRGVGDGGEGRMQIFTWDVNTDQNYLYVFKV